MPKNNRLAKQLEDYAYTTLNAGMGAYILQFLDRLSFKSKEKTSQMIIMFIIDNEIDIKIPSCWRTKIPEMWDRIENHNKNV